LNSPTSLRSRRFIAIVSILALGLAGWLPVVNFLSLFVRDELGGGITGTGLLLAAMHGSRSTIGIFVGVVLGRFGSQRAYAFGLTGLAALVAIMAVTPDLRLLVIAAPFGGLALTMHWAAAQTYVMEAAPPDRRGLASSIMSFVVVAAPGIGGVILGTLANTYGFRLFAIIAAALLALAALSAMNFLPAANTPSSSTSPSLRRLTTNLLQMLRHPAVQILALIRACTTVIYGAFIILAGPKLVAAGGDLADVGWLIFVAAVAGATAQVLVGAMSDRIGRRGALAVTLVIGAITTAIYGQAHGFFTLLALWAGYAFTQSAFQSLIVAIAADIAPPRRLSQIMAIDSTAYSVGVTAAAILAMMTGETKPAIIFWAGSAAGLVAVAAVSRLPASYRP
jgi:predicted MFS family arabinose efflux permease